MKKHVTIYAQEGDRRITARLIANEQAVSETVTYTVEKSLCRGYTFMFLNRRGGFDTCHLQGVPESELQTVREFFENRDGRQTVSIESRESKVVQSAWLTKADLKWMVQIIESPMVYFIENLDEDRRVLRKAVILNKGQQTNSRNLIRMQLEFVAARRRRNQTSADADTVIPMYGAAEGGLTWESTWD